MILLLSCKCLSNVSDDWCICWNRCWATWTLKFGTWDVSPSATKKRSFGTSSSTRAPTWCKLSNGYWNGRIERFVSFHDMILDILAKPSQDVRHTLPRCREKLSSKSYMDFSTLLAPFCLSAAFSATMAERRCSSQALLEPDGENGWEWHKKCKTCWTWLVIDVCIHIIYIYIGIYMYTDMLYNIL